MPSPQLKPLLPCDIENNSPAFSSSGYRLQSSSSLSSSSAQQTVTFRQPIKIKKEEPEEVSKANSVYSFEPKIYDQAFSPVKIEKKDASDSNVFFSGLDSQVKVIL